MFMVGGWSYFFSCPPHCELEFYGHQSKCKMCKFIVNTTLGFNGHKFITLKVFNSANNTVLEGLYLCICIYVSLAYDYLSFNACKLFATLGSILDSQQS